MAEITKQEEGRFRMLFNRSGYVRILMYLQQIV